MIVRHGNTGIRLLLPATLLAGALALPPVTAEGPAGYRFTVRLDRGPDVGQAFGSLFEARSEDGSLTVGAGFPNGYNTRYRVDRHAVQFYVRLSGEPRPLRVEALPRPSELCGAYLFGRDGVLYSTYGGLQSWDEKAGAWRSRPEPGGTSESMRVGDRLLEFGAGVKYDGRTILPPPALGSYELFFYANGHLCFYHVHRNGKGYRAFTDEAAGFSKLYACPWTPDQATVDLSRAAVLRLPIVGETTFAWGQWKNQLVTGSNIGGFYVFENGRWTMLLPPNLQVSYQLYSSLGYRDGLLMGQYPTGRLFEYDGKTIRDRAGWPPVPAGVSGSAREAQTTALYGGELFVGVWPWGELWRHPPGGDKWSLDRRMFDHPAATPDVVHPYDVENRGNPVGNLWGQRVTSLIPLGDSLYVAISAKSPVAREPTRYPFLEPEKWKSYGSVYRLTMPGHLSAPTRWTKGPTVLDFQLREGEMSIRQDGRRIGTARLSGSLPEALRRAGRLTARWAGSGLYGPFGGRSLSGSTRE